MERALWLLLWLRLTSWFRRLTRNLKTVKGVLLAVLGGGMIVLWLSSFVIQRFLPGQEHKPPPLEEVRLFGPLILLAYCVLSSAFSAGERSVTFSPAEVSFLFPGPFTRRRLLLYKITGGFLISQLTTLFMVLMLSQYTRSFLAAFVGISLAMMFVQLFAMALALLASLIGAKAYNRRRRLALFAVLLVLAVGLGLQARASGAADAGALFRALAESPIVQAVLTPLRWFVDAFTAEAMWPDLIVGAVLSLAVDLALLGLVLGLDAHYLEAAAAASEKTYARLQRLRTSGGAAAWGALGGKARFSLPSLPNWGGIGPIAWRQLVSASRGMKGLLIFFVFLGVMMIWPLFVGTQVAGDEQNLAHRIAGTLLGVSLFTLPMMLTFDFRGDVDRIDILKSLPIAPWRLAIGQLLTPVLLTAALQLVLMGVLAAIWGGMELFLLGTLCFVLPVNFLLYGIENLVFLWFPTRMASATPGDFQAMGRYMLLFIAKMFIIGATVGVAVAAGSIVYLISDNYWAAGAAAIPVVVVAALALIPLIALAFRRFDVARDTPA